MLNGVKLDSRPGWLGAGQDASVPGWLGVGQDVSVVSGGAVGPRTSDARTLSPRDSRPGWLGAGQDASVVSGGAVGPRASVIGSLTSMLHLGGGSPQTSIENHIEVQDDLR